MTKFITVDNIKVPVEGERNLLEVIRKANVDLPTFCYHSELSIYGSCRMCLVDTGARALAAACVMPVSDGMVVKTNTPAVRNARLALCDAARICIKNGLYLIGLEAPERM